MYLRLLPILLLLSASPPAHADPAFTTIDRYDSTSKAGASVTWLNIDAARQGGQRLEVYGQYLVPRGFGGYAALSGARSTADGLDDIWTAGNTEVGGLWADPNIPFRTVLRAGVVLATAGDGVDDTFANLQATYPRHTDMSHVTGAVTWLRLAMSPRLRRGKGFYRLDLGVDAPILGDGKDDANTLLRFNIAAGLDTGNAAATVELANLITLGDPGDDIPRFVHNLAVGVRILSWGDVRPSATIVIPLDDPGKKALNWALLLGAEYTLAQ